MNTFKTLTLCLAVTLIVSCKKAEEIQGRYHGVLKKGKAAKQVVTEVPGFSEVGNNQVLNFSLYETLASAKPELVSVKVEDKTVVLKGTFLGEREYRLKLENENCGIGETDQDTAVLCLQAASITFQLKSKVTGEVSFDLNLIKNGDLPVPPSADNLAGIYTIDELVGRAKFSNYSVVQDAERVFQARQRIKNAIGNLLPRFNLKDLLSFVGGPLGGIEAIGNFVPFIFPSNWYKKAEAKELEKAQSKSFASLRGNEIQLVENMFYLVQRDQLLLAIMQAELGRQRETHRIIEKKERFGLLPPRSADKYLTNVLLMEQDFTELQALLLSEFSSLGHAVALPPATGVNDIKSIPLPDLSTANPIDVKILIEPAQKKSFEVATLGYLAEASKLNKKIRAWGFLDPTSSDTIGFGYASMLRIEESQTRILISKKEEMLSTIEQKIYSAVNEYNASVQSFKISQAGINTAQARLDRLQKRLKSGDEKIDDEYFVQEMVEASQSHLKFSANRLSAVHSNLIARSKISRLLLEGYYENLELFNK